MDAGKRTISEIFTGNKMLEVPFFQRAYVWQEENWERFLEDLENVCSSQVPYFMGSLILKQQMTNSNSRVGDIRLVIDGQQRLTTISILMKVLSLKTGKNEEFRRSFTLVNGDPVLCHNRNDQPAFNRIMKLESLEDLQEIDNITKAYQYFAKYADPGKLDFDMICYKVLFVGIDLDQEEDEQQIFDTINSLGVVLTTAELLKNYFFSRKDIDSYTESWYNVFEKDEETRQYWDTEITTGRIKRTFIDVFFYAFLLIKLQDNAYNVTAEEKNRLSKFDRLFESYKYFIKNKCNDDRMSILNEIREYATCFRKTIRKNVIWEELTAESGIDRINAIIFTFDVTTMIPYVLFAEKNVANETERNRLYDALESYISRRVITRDTTKNYNRLFAERLILNKVLSREEFICNMQNSDDVNNRIPSNGSLLRAFHENVLLNSYAAGILYLIESKIRNRNKHSTAPLGIAKYSLEHMMPKNWQKNWKIPGVVINEERRNHMLLTLGNLTIITASLNSAIRDSDWKTKKAGTKARGGLRKYAEGIETLSDYLDLEEWNEDCIFNRAEWLYSRAADIWKIEGVDDVASYEPDPQKQQDESSEEKPVSNIPLTEEKTRSGEEGTILEVRRRYWAFALKKIKEEHGPNGAFANVNTSKEYWINGYIGIGGFRICCEAALDRADVLLTLGKSDRELNKSAFEYLEKRKEKVEKSLGTNVEWWKYNEGKEAYVHIGCKAPVGIYKEDTWETMAAFHAEWSKKFYDVLVPLLYEWKDSN